MTGAPRTRVARRPVHGVLMLDKPLGWSSNDALQKCKWLLRAEKAGHTGTLDPLATGVLPLTFGAATKFGQFQLDADKTYTATLRLGVKTSTGDAEGDVLAERPVPEITDEVLRELERRFAGDSMQMPPMHSALKKDGKPLYEYAREGVEVAREARRIWVFELKLRRAQGTRASIAIEMIATVSRGTYVRTLGEDIGEALGCGAHLASLRRLATGGATLAGCTTIESLEAMDDVARLGTLLPVDSLVERHTSVTLGAEDAGRFLSGLRRRGNWPDAERIAVYTQAEGGRRDFLGTAHAAGGELIPQRLLNPQEIRQIAGLEP